MAWNKTSIVSLRKQIDLLSHMAKSWEGQTRAGLRKDWVQRPWHPQYCLSLQQRPWWLQVRTLRGSQPERRIWVRISGAPHWEIWKELRHSNLDHVPISWTNHWGQGGSHGRRWPSSFRPQGLMVGTKQSSLVKLTISFTENIFTMHILKKAFLQIVLPSK